MRGNNDTPQSFWHRLDLEELIESNRPLRGIERMVDEALRGMDADFRKAYSGRGRPSIAPERQLKALLLQTLESIRPERELYRRRSTDLVPRHDVRQGRLRTDRLHPRSRAARRACPDERFFGGVVKQAQAAGLASDEHSKVDGSLIQSHASLQSLQQIAREGDGDGGDNRPSPGGGSGKSRNESVDFRGERRGIATYRSSTDP